MIVGVPIGVRSGAVTIGKWGRSDHWYATSYLGRRCGLQIASAVDRHLILKSCLAHASGVSFEGLIVGMKSHRWDIEIKQSLMNGGVG